MICLRTSIQCNMTHPKKFGHFRPTMGEGRVRSTPQVSAAHACREARSCPGRQAALGLLGGKRQRTREG